MTLLARPGNIVEAPRFLAGVYVVGRQEPADAVLAAGRPNDHLVFHHQWGMCDGIAGFRVGHLGIPQQLPVFGVDGYDVRVDGSHEQRVAENREAAVYASAAQAGLWRRTIRVDPKDSARGG